MPVQTAIQVRRGTASSWTSTNPTLAAGEIGFETDTGKFKIGTGSATWSSLAYTAIPESIFAAKGDILTATGNDAAAVLTAGSNGDTLVADSAASTGLRWSATPSASNPIVNSAMDVWQRGTSFSFTNALTYTADRWQGITDAGATTMQVTRQATGDTTNLPFIQYCARVARTTTGTNDIYLSQSFESVNSIPYAGKTVTFSFYARKGSGYSATSSNLVARLVTGTGTDQNVLTGLTGGATAIDGSATLTTTWQRFSFAATLSASLTQLALFFRFTPVGSTTTNDYFEVTGVQIDVGSVALPFRRSGGTIQGELAACQRYYWRAGGDSGYQPFGLGRATATTTATMLINNPVPMRTKPSSVDFANLGLGDFVSVSSSLSGLTLDYAGTTTSTVNVTGASGLTSGTLMVIRANNSTSAYIGMSAEL